MNYEIKSIPADQQRYPTCGDYWDDTDAEGKPVKRFRVSDMDNEDYHFLVSIHEQIEEHLTRRRGLTEPEIKAFDEKYEAEREAGLHSDDDEPGFDPAAPYLREHTIATGIEMMLAGHMGISWGEYDKAVMES
jgi:hypothetical protein